MTPVQPFYAGTKQGSAYPEPKKKPFKAMVAKPLYGGKTILESFSADKKRVSRTRMTSI